MDRLLTELRGRLERLGYVVVPHGDHLCVRLPLMASIRVYSSEGGVRFVSRFGPFGRTTGLVATSGAGVGLVGAAVMAVGVAPGAFLAGFIGVAALAHDVCRFVLTESYVTRLQQLVIDLQREIPALPLASPRPNEIGSEHGVDVGAQPIRRTAVPVNRPGNQ